MLRVADVVLIKKSESGALHRYPGSCAVSAAKDLHMCAGASKYVICWLASSPNQSGQYVISSGAKWIKAGNVVSRRRLRVTITSNKSRRRSEQKTLEDDQHIHQHIKRKPAM